MKKLTYPNFKMEIIERYGLLDLGEDSFNLKAITIIDELRNLNTSKESLVRSFYLNFLYLSVSSNWESKYTIFENIYINKQQVVKLINKIFNFSTKDNPENLISTFETVSKKHSVSLMTNLVCLFIHDKIDIFEKDDRVLENEYFSVLNIYNNKEYVIMFLE